MSDAITLRDAMSQAQIRALSEIKRDKLDVVTLYVIQNNAAGIACLIVARDADAALDFVSDLGLNGWMKTDVQTRHVLRNVGMEAGAKMIIPMDAQAAFRMKSDAAKRKKKIKYRRRRAAIQQERSDDA